MIEETIRIITESQDYYPSSGDNLMGMEYDIDHCFESNEVFSKVSVACTKDKRCMFNIKVEVSESVSDFHDIRRSIKDSWEFIRYSYFEASSVTFSKDKAVLRFITAIGENKFYVTGCITILGQHYQYLAKGIKGF